MFIRRILFKNCCSVSSHEVDSQSNQTQPKSNIPLFEQHGILRFLSILPIISCSNTWARQMQIVMMHSPLLLEIAQYFHEMLHSELFADEIYASTYA